MILSANYTALGRAVGRAIHETIGNIFTISGFAYPNETLVAPAGTSYQWYIDDVASGTSQTLIPDVYDIGLVVRCVVDGVECTPVTVWHPNQIFAVKHFWWAAQGAYNTIANGITEENTPINATPSGYSAVTLTRNGSQNGKARYDYLPSSSYCYWDSANSRWELYVAYGDEQSLTEVSLNDTTYPWQATWNSNSVTVARVATTVDSIATNNQPVTGWRDIIGGAYATAVEPNAGLFVSGDLDTPSIKFDPVGQSTDFFTLASSQRSVFNGKNYCYIFAGAQDPIANQSGSTGGDATHGVVGINRSSVGSRPKVGLVTKIDVGGNLVFSARAGLNSNTTFSANLNPSNTNYNVLATEALYGIGRLKLRVNGNEAASSNITVETPNSTTSPSYIGAYNSATTTNFNGYMTAVILAADEFAPISDTDRARIERFIGLLDGLNVAYEGIGAPRVGSDNPANAAEPNATAWVLMDGPFGPSEGTFYGGQSWRKMAPIGYAPYGNETYVYGDETVRYETGVWLYINSGLGEIARAYSYEPYPWLATTWNNGFTAAKITSTYIKTTNYPAVP